MGSQGIKRRKPRPRRPAGGDDPAPEGGWELQNSPYTFEGQMEGLRRFGRGVSYVSPRLRLMAVVVALLFVLPIVVGFCFWLFD